jgi:hypothetical protein
MAANPEGWTPPFAAKHVWADVVGAPNYFGIVNF